MRKIFFASMLIVGTILGAGFCSGKEIVTYFAKYGFSSLFMIPILFFLYYYIFKLFMSAGEKKNYVSIDSVNKFVFSKKNKAPNFLLFIVYLVFTSAMFAGLFQLGQMFNSNLLSWVLVIIFFALTFILLLKPFNFLGKINSVLIPVFILVFAFLCLFGIFKLGNTSLESVPNYRYLLPFNPFIYACQALAISYYILVKAGENLNKTQIKKTALLSAVILCLLQIIAITVLCFNPELTLDAMPLVSLALKLGDTFFLLYSFVLLIAIVTTLFAVSRSLNDIVLVRVKNKYLCAFISLVAALILSFFKFENLVNYLYPIIGCIGLYIFISLINTLFFKSPLKKTDKKVHKTSQYTK